MIKVKNNNTRKVSKNQIRIYNKKFLAKKRLVGEKKKKKSTIMMNHMKS